MEKNVMRGRHADSKNTISPKLEKKGRTCKASGCKTVLSMYNKDDLCWQHSHDAVTVFMDL